MVTCSNAILSTILSTDLASCCSCLIPLSKLRACILLRKPARQSCGRDLMWFGLSPRCVSNVSGQLEIGIALPLHF